MFGLGRYGGTIGRRLLAEKRSVLGVDFDPEAVRRWRRDGLSVPFGDLSDPELIRSLPLRDVKWVISTVPSPDTGVGLHDSRRALIHALRESGFSGKIAVATHEGDGDVLKTAGAQVVLHPYHDAADRAVELVLARKLGERHEVEDEEQKAIG